MKEKDLFGDLIQRAFMDAQDKAMSELKNDEEAVVVRVIKINDTRRSVELKGPLSDLVPSVGSIIGSLFNSMEEADVPKDIRAAIALYLLEKLGKASGMVDSDKESMLKNIADFIKDGDEDA